MSEITPQEVVEGLNAAHQRKIGTYLDRSNAPVETIYSRAAALITAQAEQIERMTGEIETRFWSIVDREGLTGLPSDMWAALETLVNRAARTALQGSEK